jgi:hypothetical protein
MTTNAIRSAAPAADLAIMRAPSKLIVRGRLVPTEDQS